MPKSIEVSSTTLLCGSEFATRVNKGVLKPILKKKSIVVLICDAFVDPRALLPVCVLLELRLAFVRE